VTGKDLLKRVREQPFVPFRVVISEGASYEVRHPDQIMVRRDSAVIGLPSDEDGLVDATVMVDLIYVISLDPIAPKKTKGKSSNGK
jgi:hypothetical protein